LTSVRLKEKIVDSLRKQGFRVQGRRLYPPNDTDKEELRLLHAGALRHRIEASKKGLASHEARLLTRIAAGSEVAPERMSPCLVEVLPDSEDELLFRYAKLHWSIPVSPGYGRRLRFLVIDQANGKLIGLFGLGDPVFSLRARDRWVGWSKELRAQRLHHVMDAFVLGAVPPYSQLICGKLVAMLMASDEVRKSFQRKYAAREGAIRGKILDGRLAMISTTSALGRSSIYNRIKSRDRILFQSVGFTQGSGEFHFSNGLYSSISSYANQHCVPTAKQSRWGHGFRNRREVVRKVLLSVGLPTDWLYHGVQREIFLVPLARNTRRFLRGEHSRLQWYHQPAQDLFEWFKERWLLPRASWDKRYKDFVLCNYRLWKEENRG
jgi:Druantia protein DruA